MQGCEIRDVIIDNDGGKIVISSSSVWCVVERRRRRGGGRRERSGRDKMGFIFLCVESFFSGRERERVEEREERKAVSSQTLKKIFWFS